MCLRSWYIFFTATIYGVISLRTISVREAASALGITVRAVTYRLEKGQLKGSLSKNEITGVPEWRIYPNKQVLEGLKKNQSTTVESSNFAPAEDTIDAVTIETNDQVEETIQENHTQEVPVQFKALIDECVRPLVEEIKQQTRLLIEKENVIQEQSRQIRLLPDLEKRAEDEKKRAEEERQAAQLRAFEIETLKKQINALEEEKSKLQLKVAEEAVWPPHELQQLKSEIAELKRPWWQKVFSKAIAS